MSHFILGVITKNDPRSQEGEVEIEKLLAPFDEQTEESKYLEFIEDSDGNIDEKTNKRGYWTNPNAKWDWYTVGGRWPNEIKLLDGTNADHAKIKDIDRTIDKDEYKKAERFWEVIVEELPLREDESKSDFTNFIKKEYYINKYGTKGRFATNASSFVPYALLTDEGQWLSKGNMGWFGMSDDSADSLDKAMKEFNKTLDEKLDHYLTIIDCHI